MAGPQTVERVLAAGVEAVETPNGEPVASGVIDAGSLRPARRGGRAVAVVQRDGDVLQPLKLD